MNPIYRFHINRESSNLLDPLTMRDGFALNASTGAVSASQGWQVSDFMPVVPGDLYALKNSQNEGMAFIAVAFYNSSFAFVGGTSSVNTVVAPAGSAYARISLPSNLDAALWQFGKSSSSYAAYVSPAVFPTFGNGLSLSFDKETGQEFFRRKLSGQLKFTGPDYAYIVAQAFDHEFKIQIQISYDRGQLWTPYWNGKFYKTDCDFNDDDKVVTVTPTLDDDYNAVIAGLEKEFDLISLAPEIVPVKMDKRPMLQYYGYGENVVGCYLSGMWWEQQCGTPENEQALYDAGFVRVINRVTAAISQTASGSPQLPSMMYFEMPVVWTDNWVMSGGGYSLSCASVGLGQFVFRIYQTGGNILWEGYANQSLPQPGYTVHLTPAQGSTAMGAVDILVEWFDIWARIVTDKETAGAIPITADDIVPDMRNYHYAIRLGGGFENTVVLDVAFSETPTEWGLYETGKYYAKPYSLVPGMLFPLCRSVWSRISLWVDGAIVPATLDETYRAEFTLRDAYPIASVISVLLGQIAPGITHEDSTDYSRFLYAEDDPLTGQSHHLFVTPKSNLINSGYDQPAQKAPIRLVDVLNMLRDIYRCYWFIDEEKRFRIEHIEFFRRGGTYEVIPGPAIGFDLTTLKVPRNGKPWAFDKNKYKFEKPEMAARYQFGWMDNVTKQFNGSPIDIVSGYVEPGKIEQITVNNFTSDVDYILLNPAAISQDGFVLLCAEKVNAYSALGKKLNTDGTLADDANYNVTPYLSVTPGSSLTFFDGTGHDGTGMLVEYNANLELVDYWRPDQSARTITLSANTRFVRASLLTTGTGYVDLGNVRIYPSLAYKDYALPYVGIGDATLQNGAVSFAYLQIYYKWDMPAKKYTIDGVLYQATGVKKLKTQGVTFPSYRDPDMQKLVKTLMGNGMIEKLSLNLCSRFADATLRYDTE